MAIVAVLSLGVSLPILGLLVPARIAARRVLAIVLGGTGLALLIALAKLHAVFAMLRLFPRLVPYNGPAGWAAGLTGLGAQLVGYPTLFLASAVCGQDASTAVGVLSHAAGHQYGLWELDTYVTPVLLLAPALLFLRRRPPEAAPTDSEEAPHARWLWIGLLVLALVTAFSLALARGPLYELLKQLPVLRALHVNTRYASAFHSRLRSRAGPLVLSAVSVMIYSLYLAPVLGNTELCLTLDLTSLDAFHQRIREGYQPAVQAVLLESDGVALAQNGTSLFPFDPLWGYSREGFQTRVVPGSVWQVNAGRYNLTNPDFFFVHFHSMSAIRLSLP